MAGTFGLILGISILMSQYNESQADAIKEGKIGTKKMILTNVLNSIISWVIVIFNKFVLGKVTHMITDTEK